MNIEASKPIRIEGVSPSGSEQRQMLPTRRQGSDLQPHQEVDNSSAGNIIGMKETDKALRELDQAVEAFNVSLKFTRDEETGTIVVEVIDQRSGETLSQFPNGAMLQLAATLSKLQGKIFDCQA
jgi:flagellar protein FlaG